MFLLRFLRDLHFSKILNYLLPLWIDFLGKIRRDPSILFPASNRGYIVAGQQLNPHFDSDRLDQTFYNEAYTVAGGNDTYCDTLKPINLVYIIKLVTIILVTIILVKDFANF